MKIEVDSVCFNVDPVNLMELSVTLRFRKELLSRRVIDFLDLGVGTSVILQ